LILICLSFALSLATLYAHRSQRALWLSLVLGGLLPYPTPTTYPFLLTLALSECCSFLTLVTLCTLYPYMSTPIVDLDHRYHLVPLVLYLSHLLLLAWEDVAWRDRVLARLGCASKPSEIPQVPGNGEKAVEIPQ
jgi:hypothetical protein